MFVFTARTLLAEMERHAPDVLRGGAPGGEPGATEDLDFIRLEPEAFDRRAQSSASTTRWPSGPSRAAVVPADLGWSDVGSWGALWELGAKDADGNVAVGDVLLEGADNCYVRSDGIADRGGGAEGRGGGGDRGCGAGDAPRPGAGREEAWSTGCARPGGARRWRITASIGPGASTRA